MFDIEKETWKRIKPRGQVSNRKGHTACLNGNEIVIFGGQPMQSGNETGILSIKEKDRNIEHECKY